jgi:hypothetical protein
VDVNEKVNKGSKEKKMQFNFSFYPESPKPGTRALKAHESKLLFKVLLFLLTDLHLTLKDGKRFVLHQSQTAHNAFFSRIVDAGGEIPTQADVNKRIQSLPLGRPTR